MSNPDTFVVLAQHAAHALQPLVAAYEEPDSVREFLEQLGWLFEAAPPALDTLREPAREAFSLVSVGDGLDPDNLPRLVASLSAVFQAIADLSADESLPADFRDEFPRQLIDYLLVEYLLGARPRIGYLLMILGIISVEHQPAAGRRGPYQRRIALLESLPQLVTDPFGAAKTAHRWGQSDFAGATLLNSVAGLFAQSAWRLFFGLADSTTAQTLNTGALQPDQNSDEALLLTLLDVLQSPTSFNAGAGLFLTPETVNAKPGFALLPFATAGEERTFPLSAAIELQIQSNLDLTSGAGILIRPDTDPEFVLGLSSGSPRPASGDLRAQMRVANPGAPVTLIGSPDASRFELAGASTTVGTRLSAQGTLDVFAEFALEQAKLIIQPAAESLDGFLSSLLPDDGLQISLSPTIGISKERGVYFAESDGLQLSVPTHVSLGPIEIQSVLLAVKSEDRAVSVDLATSVKTSLGVLDLVVEHIGLKARFSFPPDRNGNLGPLQFDLGFRAPDRVAVAVDAQGVLSGGGFLYLNEAEGLYAGAMQLSLQDSITLTAYGVIATRLPDGGRGYSVLIFITADGFKPVPLGFGFVLQSIGGIVGINRTFDQAVLRAGLKSDSLSTLLFPQDPIINATTLIQALSQAFPAKAGSYLLGLMARISWFTPTLVLMDLALILEFGARERLLALGRISALLPSADNDLIRLKLDAIGVLDFDAGTLEADAVLVDSRLAGRFPITGSGALRARWPTNPDAPASSANFVLAVGGLNPHFAPPTGFPALERVAIALTSGSNPRLVCDAYFALTANTVQFGARTSLYAEAVGFSVSGDVSFDALVTLLPLHFIVDFHAGVQLKRGSHNLFKVTLDGTLEGPLPLRLSARAKFEIFWFSFSVHFNYTLADGDAAESTVPAVSLIDELTRALNDSTSWSTRPPTGAAQGVALRSLSTSAASGSALVLDPSGQLILRQQVAPLNTSRDIDTFGGAPIAGPRRFQLTATLNGDAGKPAAGAFAPTRYFVMSDDDKLAAPSFEDMDAGLVLGDSSPTFDAATIVPAPLEYVSVTLNPPGAASASLASPRASASPATYAMPLDALKAQSSSGAAAKVPVRRVGRARFRNHAAQPAATVNPVQWRIVDVNGTEATLDPSIRTWSEYRSALNALNRGGARWLMVPAHESNTDAELSHRA